MQGQKYLGERRVIQEAIIQTPPPRSHPHTRSIQQYPRSQSTQNRVENDFEPSQLKPFQGGIIREAPGASHIQRAAPSP